MDGDTPLLGAPQKTTGYLVISTIAGVLGAFQFGYASSVLNPPSKQIQAEFNVSKESGQWALAVSIFAISGLMSASMAGGLADKLGRRNFLLLNSVPFLAAGALGALSKSILMLTISRFAVGLGCGGATGT